MAEGRPGRLRAAIILLIGIAAALTWLTLWLLNRPATEAGQAAVTSRGPPPVSSATTPPVLLSPVTSATVPSAAAGTAIDTREQDERQIAKISRGLGTASSRLVVLETPPGSVVGQLHLLAGDIIVSANGKPVSSPEDFARMYKEQGLPRQLTIMRNGKEMHRH